MQAIEGYRQEQKGARLLNDSLVRATEEYLLAAEALKAGFDPAQPRVPAGNSDGGQWTDGGDAGGGGNRVIDRTLIPLPVRRPNFSPYGHPINDPPIRPVYPVETALAVLMGGHALVVARVMVVRAAGIPAAEAVGASIAGAARASTAKIERAVLAVEEYLGGKPSYFKLNKDKDLVIMRGDKKVRFDINNTSGDKPHFHLQRKTPNGKWKNVVQHRHYFKGDE